MAVRIGILGFAHGHVGMYCQQWKAMPSERVALIAGCDHDAERLRTSAEKWGLTRCDTAAELLARPDVDAVVIAAETSLHAAYVELAAAAGKAVILQKPLCLTLAEADRIVAAVAGSRVPFTLAWQMRVDPQNLTMRDLVRSGELGRVYQVRRRHCLSTHRWAGFENSWHVKPELNRGMWADDAAHPIDWLYWMFGRPATVIAEIDTLHNPQVPDDHGIAVYRYDDGLMAEVTCSFTALAGENTTEIVAEKGMVLQNFGDLTSCNAPRQHLGPAAAQGLKWMTNDGGGWVFAPTPSPAGHGARIEALAEPLLQFLEGRRPAIATATEGREVLIMTLASYESARLGRRVRLDEIRTASLPT